MKSSKLLLLLFITSFLFNSISAQVQGSTNASLNILTANAGVVAQGAILDLSVSVTNTGMNPILANRIRVQISIPSSLALPLVTGLQTSLFTNWIVTSNNQTNGVITICNSTDVIPAGETRTSIIKISANTVGSQLTISAGLAFGTAASCTGFGSLPGDISGDNISTTTMTVISAPLPLVLTNFSAILKDCQPVLRWTTESEINSERFEIEKRNTNGIDWKKIGSIAAKGLSSSIVNYNFVDNNLDVATEKVLYRLKMIDKDGRFEYSEILPVLVNCKTAQILVYPNPVQDGKLYVSLAGTVGYVEANLMSLSGQVILKSKMTNGSNYLDVSNVADAMYMLNIKDANGFNKNVKVFIKH
jgi:Secretion system C-terminal sorting domain